MSFESMLGLGIAVVVMLALLAFIYESIASQGKKDEHLYDHREPWRIRPAEEGHMKEYRIEVTWEDIRRGQRGSVHLCPTALALERAGGAGVYFPLESFPPSAQRFIRDFDAGRPVEPIIFIMEDWREQRAEAVPAYRAQEVRRDARFEPKMTEVAPPAPERGRVWR